MTLPDCVKLEMDLAALMAQQQASGFRFDVKAAERVRGGAVEPVQQPVLDDAREMTSAQR